MYVDTRLGGVKRYYANQPKDYNMRIQNAFLDCVVFLISHPTLGIDKPEGTAFLFGIPLKKEDQEVTAREGFMGFYYLVTAGHVATALRGKSFTILVNNKDGQTRIKCDEENKWIFHEDPTVDVAVMNCPFREEDKLTVRGLSSQNLAITPDKINRLGIGIGDEVFSVALFADFIDTKKNWPILRTGSIAMMPEDKLEIKISGDWVKAEVYLVESRSIGGMSGSPVFVVPTPGAKSDGTISGYLQAVPRETYLLGLTHGHWDIEYKVPNLHLHGGFTQVDVNSGICVVIPATKIMETIYQPKLEQEREKSRQEWLEKNGPKPD